MNLPKLIIIVPCYNEQEVFHYCREKLSSLLTELIEEKKIAVTSHILFVDDGSNDKTWNYICRSSENDNRIFGIKLSKNVGHQNALIAGLSYIDCDISITIDADLQDDFKMIRNMLSEYQNGSEIVFGVRSNRVSDGWFKKTSAEVFYKLLSFMKVDHIENHADFRLMSSRVTKALLQHNESNLYLRGLVRQLGFESSVVEYERSERNLGETKYPLRKMLSLALSAITSTSTKPLRIIAYIGFCISLFSFLAGIQAIYVKFMGETIDGWTSLITSIYFLGGVQLLSLGIIGEYVGRIYIESKNRPRYFIQSKTNNDDQKV